MTFSQITVTHFEQLKHGLPLYQDKHHQTTKFYYVIQQESKGFWDYWRLPVQLCPFLVNPGLHVHTYDPCVLLHVASLWHLPKISSHLSVSVVKLEKNKDKKKIHKISTKDIRFLVSIKEPQELGNSQKPQFICSFLLYVVLWWDLLIKLLFLSSPCSYYIKHSTHTWTAPNTPNVRGKQKNKIKKTKTTKKSDKPKQNKTKIYKRANEDYVTTKYFYILRFSTSYKETNSRHFQQLKNICHTSIKKKKNKIKKKTSYAFISILDLDLYPYHNVLPQIQEDISIDIPWM